MNLIPMPGHLLGPFDSCVFGLSALSNQWGERGRHFAPSCPEVKVILHHASEMSELFDNCGRLNHEYCLHIITQSFNAISGRHWIGGKKRGKYYWDPKIIFGRICSFSIIGNDETNVSVVVRTSTYRDKLLVSLCLRHFETLWGTSVNPIFDLEKFIWSRDTFFCINLKF